MVSRDLLKIMVSYRHGLMLAIFCFISMGEDCQAKEAKIKDNTLTVEIGKEYLEYREDEYISGLTSKADTSNTILSISWEKKREELFVVLRGTAPLSVGRTEENWYIADILSQKNSLKYAWQRYDVLAGGAPHRWIRLFAGVRRSLASQVRKDFVKGGTSYNVTSTEKIEAWFFLAGLSGQSAPEKKLRFNYLIEYFSPLSVMVTNSYYPGLKIRDSEGYAYEAKGGAKYNINKSVTLDINVSIGRVHWNGSDQVEYGAKLIKWPENDTKYYIGTLGISLEF